jgi:6-phosphogluconolactonase (cycloisomerase 2 family)
LAFIVLGAFHANGQLITHVQTVIDGVNGVDGLSGTFYVTVSPDGTHVYASGGNESALAAFSRDGATGELTFIEAQVNGQDGVGGLAGGFYVAMSPEGTHVYVAGQTDHALSVFSRDGATGALTFVETKIDGQDGVDGLAGAIGVTVSPDGAHVYAAGIIDNALSVFSRDGATGALTFVEAHFDDLAGVNGLLQASSVTVSPDGAHVYATGFGDHSFAVFSRDGATGALTFVEAKIDGQDGVDGLEGACSAAMSPDGAHVYAVGNFEHALAVFSRDGSSGALTFVEVVRDGVNGVDGIEFAFTATVSPDGAHVFAAGSTDNAIAVFSRNIESGALTFVEKVQNGVNGVEGLSGALSVTLSPDGAHVYATSNSDSAIVGFEKGVLVALSGRLTNGQSLAGVSCGVVELTSSDQATVRSAVTDVNGEYFFADLLPDVYTVRLFATGFGEFSAEPIDLTSGAVLNQVYTLDPQQLIGGVRGIVTDSDSGEPLVGVLVQAFVDGELVASTYTCASGEYELSGLVQKGGTTVTLSFSLANYQLNEEDVQVAPDSVTVSNQEMEKDLQIQGSLTGQVRQAAGNDPAIPLPNAQVTIRGPVNTSTVSRQDDGTYAFPALLEGSYSIRASAPDFVGQTAHRTVVAEEIVEKTFTLIPTGVSAIGVNTTSLYVDEAAGSTTFTVSNDGGGLLNWSAVETCDWVDLSLEGGSLIEGQSSIVTVNFSVNDSMSSRNCVITISDSAETGSPREITLTQTGETVTLVAPFFLDNAAAGGGITPPEGTKAFIGVKNLSNRSIVLEVSYADPLGTNRTPTKQEKQLISVAPFAGVSWRPAVDDPGLGSTGFPIMTTGGPKAGRAIITADGPIVGRLVQVSADRRSSYRLAPLSGDTELVAPFFLDNGNADGELVPVVPDQAKSFLGVMNLSNQQITISVEYTDALGNARTPQNNSFSLEPLGTIGWRPVLADPIIEPTGADLPKFDGPGVKAGSAIIRATGPIAGRLVETSALTTQSYKLPAVGNEQSVALAHFLDDDDGDSSVPPVSGFRSFVGVKNLTNTSGTLTFDYRGIDGSAQWPNLTTHFLGAGAGIGWRPATIDNRLEGDPNPFVPDIASGFREGHLTLQSEVAIAARFVWVGPSGSAAHALPSGDGNRVLVVPFFLDNGSNDGTFKPNQGVATYIHVANTTDTPINFTVDYREADGDSRTRTGAGAYTLAARASVYWRPFADDPGIEGPGAAVPNMTAEGAAGGSAIITGTAPGLMGRIVVFHANGSMNAYTLPSVEQGKVQHRIITTRRKEAPGNTHLPMSRAFDGKNSNLRGLGEVKVSDIEVIINLALGLDADVKKDNQVNAVDVQLAINDALGSAS